MCSAPQHEFPNARHAPNATSKVYAAVPKNMRKLLLIPVGQAGWAGSHPGKVQCVYGRMFDALGQHEDTYPTPRLYEFHWWLGVLLRERRSPGWSLQGHP